MKAEAVIDSLVSNNQFKDIIVSADTIVVCDDKILEKPDDQEGAKSMLKMLSGRSHTVMTGVTIGYKHNLLKETPLSSSSIIPEYYYCEFVETTQVKFASLNDDIINAYVATGESMDKGIYKKQ